MVFGWGKKKDVIEHKIESIEPVHSEIKLTEIPKIIDNIENLRQKTLVSEIKVFRNKIDSDRKNLLSIANKLKNDNLKTDDLDNHIKIILNRAISDVSSTIQKEFQSSFAEINSISDVLEFERLSSKAIKKVVDVLRKHKTGIALFAKKYARKFKDDLEILDSYLQEIKNLTSNYKSNQEFLSIINENIEKISLTRDTITTQNKRTGELDNSLKQEISRLDDLKKTESEIISSSEYNDYTKTREKLDGLVPEEKKLRYGLDENFVKISRPLNKYVHISSLDKPLKILHEKLLQSPYDILSENNLPDIIKILDSVKSAISSGAISVKDTEKSIEQISTVKQLLPNLINEKMSFSKNKSVHLSNLEKFDFDRFQTCKRELEKSENEISNLESKRNTLKKQIQENEKLMSDIFTTLEINLKSASSISYKIIRE
jgi:chromosome segregation ATPase